MTANTSATGGFIVPSSATPIDDDALDDALQAVVVGITGLSGSLVRPRWQLVPPQMPEITVNWCAIGVINETADQGLPTLIHDGADNGGLGSSTSYQQSQFEVMASFYGPNARSLARLLCDGLMIAQNREAFYNMNMSLLGKPGAAVHVPELINEQWRNRVDITFDVRRKTIRTWPVENALGVQITVNEDDGSSQTFTVPEP